MVLPSMLPRCCPIHLKSIPARLPWSWVAWVSVWSSSLRVVSYRNNLHVTRVGIHGLSWCLWSPAYTMSPPYTYIEEVHNIMGQTNQSGDFLGRPIIVIYYATKVSGNLTSTSSPHAQTDWILSLANPQTARSRFWPRRPSVPEGCLLIQHFLGPPMISQVHKSSKTRSVTLIVFTSDTLQHLWSMTSPNTLYIQALKNDSVGTHRLKKYMMWKK